MSYLDKDLSLQLTGRRQSISSDVHRLGEQHLSKDFLEVGGHETLLHDAAVVLDGQDDWKAEGRRQQRHSDFPPPVVSPSHCTALHYTTISCTTQHCTALH